MGKKNNNKKRCSKHLTRSLSGQAESRAFLTLLFTLAAHSFAEFLIGLEVERGERRGNAQEHFFRAHNLRKQVRAEARRFRLHSRLWSMLMWPGEHPDDINPFLSEYLRSLGDGATAAADFARLFGRLLNDFDMDVQRFLEGIRSLGNPYDPSFWEIFERDFWDRNNRGGRGGGGRGAFGGFAVHANRVPGRA